MNGLVHGIVTAIRIVSVGQMLFCRPLGAGLALGKEILVIYLYVSVFGE